MIRDWLAQVVGSDDLTRHDKWLCMMTPRLHLLRDLLADDGCLFISIDDNELYNLKLLADEIFGESNFQANLIWPSFTGRRNNSLTFSDEHEYILVYSKNDDWQSQLLPRDPAKDAKAYTNPDNDPRGAWMRDNPSVIGHNPKRIYPIKGPTGKIFRPPKGRSWIFSEEKYKELVADGRIYFGKDGDSSPSPKRYLANVQGGLRPGTVLDKETVKHTTAAKKQFKELFPEMDEPFATLKPYQLIQHLIMINQKKDDMIILDAFAGTGTTGQAVLDLNKVSGSRHRFILIQQANDASTDTNIASDYLYERLRRFCQKEKIEAGITYKRLGAAIDKENLLDGDLPTYQDLGEYIFYIATGIDPTAQDVSAKNNIVGRTDRQTIYLIYDSNRSRLERLALDLDWVNEYKPATQAGHENIVYAPACFLSNQLLEDNNIRFVNLPNNLFNRIEN